MLMPVGATLALKGNEQAAHIPLAAAFKIAKGIYVISLRQKLKPVIDAPANAGNTAQRWTNAMTIYPYLDFSKRTYHGIINVTSDSFSGDGILNNVCCSLQRNRRILVCRCGADILDIGGESTWSWFQPAPTIEQERVLPVVRA